MNLLFSAGLLTLLVVALIGVTVYRLRQRPFSLERFRPPLEAALGEMVTPLHAAVGSLTATRLRWSGIEINARDIRLVSDDAHVWVSFAQITFRAPLTAVLSPRGLGNLTGPWLFSGATVNALPPQAPFDALHGIATATDDTLRFDIAGGRWGEVAVNRGVVILEGLDGARTRADISFHCNAPATDALQVVTTVPLDLISPSAIPAYPVEGTVEVDVRLAFAFDELPRMEHHTRAEVRDLQLQEVLAGQDLTEGRFDVTIANDAATVKGNARLGGVPTTLCYSKPAESEPETLAIDTADIGALFASLDISGRFGGGRLHVALDRTSQYNDHAWSGSVDLRDVRILQAPLLARLLTMASLTGLLSSLASDGLTVDRARAEITIKPGRIRCTSIRISIDQLEITGNIDIRPSTGQIDGEGLLIPAASLQRLVGAVPVLGAFLEGFGTKNTPIVATRFTLSGPLSHPEITVYPLSSLAPDILREIGFT